MNPTLEHALAYASRGWRVVPIGPGTKYPALERWQERATTDVNVITQHWTAHPDHGVGIATGEASGVFVLDVDVAEGKEGDATLQALEAEHGELPATVEAITGTGGRHLFYRHPPGLELNNSAGRLGSGLDVRANGGQVVAAPSIHPDTGQLYAWNLERHPDDTAVAEAPAWLLKLLEPPPKVEAGPRGDYATARLAWDRFNYSPDVTPFVALMLAEAGWTEGRPDRDGARYFTRPGKAHGISASLGKVAPGVLFVFTSSAPPLEAERSYDPADVLTALKFAGDRAAADAELVRQGWGIASWSIGDAEVAAWVDAGRSAAQVAAVEVREARWLPDDFWNARPYLRHIRQTAWAKSVAPDSVLGAVLARVAVMAGNTVRLPALVGGSDMGLTFYCAIVGPPGVGKSAAAKLAEKLLPGSSELRAKRWLDPLPIGSGEGFVDILFELVPEERDDGKAGKLVKEQTRFGALFHIDEGTALGEVAGRSGATILSTLRSAFTHATLGAVNATVEKRRILPGHEYVYGITMGLQPERAAELIADRDAGTPQRFVWLMAIDPHLPTEPVAAPVPLELGWSPPFLALAQASETSGGWTHTTLSLPSSIPEEVWREHNAKARTGLGPDGEPVEAHRTLTRLKVAALLGLLDGRAGVDLEDWRLAELVVDTSSAVRASVEQVLAHAQAQSEKSYREKLAGRDDHAAENAERRALNQAVGVLARHLERKHAEAPCSRRCAQIACKPAAKVPGGIEAVLDELVSRDHATVVDGGWQPGPAKAPPR